MSRKIETTEATGFCRALLALGLLAMTSVGAASAAEASSVRFATGSPGGTYQRLARQILQHAPSLSNGNAEVILTAGSYENAELLAAGEADLAILQGDVAYLEYYQTGNFLALAPLSIEPIQIVARRELGLSRISGLLAGDRRWIVAIGEEGSGTAAHARQVLHRLGLAAERLDLREIALQEALEAMRVRQVDVAFVTASVPHPRIEEAAHESVISVLELDGDVISSLREANPFFTRAEIPFDAYAGMERNLRTLGTESLLVARADLGAEIAQELVRAVASVAEDPESGVPALDSAALLTALDDVSIPMHPAAQRLYDDEIEVLAICFHEARRLWLPLILLVSVMVAVYRLPVFAYALRQFVLVRILAALMTIWLLGSAAMYLFESESNSNFRSFGASSIAILHYLFSGLESKYPITVPGTVLSIVILTLGVALATIFTATLVRILVERALNIRRLRPKPSFFKLRNHLLVAGWSSRAERVIHQLRSPDVPVRMPVVVLTRRTDQVRLEKPRRLRDVWVVEGDATDEEALIDADVDSARTALVLHDPDRGELADVRSVAVALALESANPEIHTVVEVMRSSELEHLGFAGVDESLDASGLAERLLGQALVTPGVVAVYDELLRFGRGSQELHFVPVPGELVGAGFTEAALWVAERPAILVGTQKPGEPASLNPPRDSVDGGPRLEDGDSLVLVADDAGALQPGWRRPWRRPWRRRSARLEVSPSARGSEEPLAAALPGAPSGTGRVERVERILLCGGGPRALHLLHRLQNEVVTAHRRFVVTVLGQEAPDSLDGLGDGLDELRFVAGNPTCRQDLEEAGIQRADHLAILADEASSGDRQGSDHRALMVALTARAASPRLHVMAEVLESSHRAHFRRVLGVEIVSVQNLSELLLAQSVVRPGILDVYRRLLTADRESNEIYMVPTPSAWVDRSFQQILVELIEGRAPVLLLGYETRRVEGEPRVILNPRHPRTELDAGEHRHHHFRQGERAVVLAYEEPWRPTRRVPRLA